jgi:hypothetical protein
MTAPRPHTVEESMPSSILNLSPAEDGETVSHAPAPMLIEAWLNSSISTDASLSMRGRWTVKGPLSSSTTSATYQATCPGAPQLFLKHPGPGADPASVQHEALVKARERLVGNPRLRVPIVYSFLLDRGFLVTEWIEGPAVSHLMESIATRPRIIARALEQAGNWLRAFHD